MFFSRTHTQYKKCRQQSDSLPSHTSPHSRPKCVDDVAMQDEVVSVLKNALEGHDVRILPSHHSRVSQCVRVFVCERELTAPRTLTLRMMRLLIALDVHCSPLSRVACMADATSLVLWTSRNREDIDDSCHCAAAVWVSFCRVLHHSLLTGRADC